MTEEFDIITLPSNLSSLDADTERRCLEQISRLQEDYRRAIAPFEKILCDIHARYGPRIFVVPKK
jgi:hypothetical protein